MELSMILRRWKLQKKKEKKIKQVVEVEQHEESKEPEIKAMAPVVEAPKPVE